MALRTIQGSANQKGKPAFLHFQKPKSENIKQDSLNVDFNKVMQNIGSEAFSYGSFKTAYDSDPRIKELVKNFSEEGIQVKTKEDAENTMQGDKTNDDTVAKMAQQATDVGAKL